MTAKIDLRCPVGPKTLLGRVQAAGLPVVVNTDNLVELSCRDCRNIRTYDGMRPKIVLHKYNIAGALVETEVIW